MTDETTVKDPEPEKPEPTEESGKKISRFWIMGVGTVVVFAVAAGIFFWKETADRNGGKNFLSAPGQIVFPVPGKKEIRFDDFLVPLPADPAHTGMSFSIVIQYRDSEWSSMTDQEKTWLRAMIYDTLEKRMREQDKPPSVDMMGIWANRAVKEIFPDRRVEEVVVDNVFIL